MYKILYDRDTYEALIQDPTFLYKKELVTLFNDKYCKNNFQGHPIISGINSVTACGFLPPTDG